MMRPILPPGLKPDYSAFKAGEWFSIQEILAQGSEPGERAEADAVGTPEEVSRELYTQGILDLGIEPKEQT
jgi:hypothetical protein